MRNLRITTLILLISVVGLFSFVSHLNKEQLIECTCYKKYDAVSKGGTRNFYMVLDAPKESFTLKVSPKTYFSTNEGSRVSFKLRPTEYKRGPMILFIQLTFITGGTLAIALLICMILVLSTLIYNKVKKDD